MSSMRRFVLLDRDGTVIVERNYLADASLVELLPGAAEGLRHLTAAGFGLVVVTNQSGIGRGYFDWPTLDAIHARMQTLLGAEGVRLDGIYVCPHTPDDSCECRKPRRGLVDQAAARLGFDPKEAVVIGDKECDVALGSRIGARTILLRTGYGAETEASGASGPDYVANDLADAARVIVALPSSSPREAAAWGRST
jgi:D-glycero-D-manno-heptose 1,7-bisphosphate phosphatase